MLHETQVRIINEIIHTHGVKRVLEIAPGPARLSCEIVGFEEGYLCDANESMLGVAERRLAQAYTLDKCFSANRRWTVVQGDAFRLPFRASFDIIYTFRFVRHFVESDRVALYTQIRSILREGGLFILDAVNAAAAIPYRMKEGLDKYPVYDELYQRDALLYELNVHGFNLLSLTEVMRHRTLQHWVQVFIGPRSFWVAKRLIQLLEYVPGQPLEWVVVCQKAGH